MEAFLDGIAVVAPVLALALFLATINERLVQFLVKPLLKRAEALFWTPYVAMVLGALISLAFGIDLLTPIADAVGAEPAVSWAGSALSALLVGAGSTFVHDVWPDSAPATLDELEPMRIRTRGNEFKWVPAGEKE